MKQFDIYVGELFERAVADQTEFLTRSLARSGRPQPLSADAA